MFSPIVPFYSRHLCHKFPLIFVNFVSELSYLGLLLMTMLQIRQWFNIFVRNIVFHSSTHHCPHFKLVLKQGLYICQWRFFLFMTEGLILFALVSFCVGTILIFRPCYIMFCLQLSRIVDGQRYTKRLNETQVTALLRATCLRPRDREANITKVEQPSC